jgi:hypothetical protein
LERRENDKKDSVSKQERIALLQPATGQQLSRSSHQATAKLAWRVNTLPPKSVLNAQSQDQKGVSLF